MNLILWFMFIACSNYCFTFVNVKNAFVEREKQRAIEK